MPRKGSEAIPESNGPTPQDAGKMATLEESRQSVSGMWGEVLQEYKEGVRTMDQCLAGLEQDARQPRLALEADGPSGTKFHGRTEGATKAVQAKHGDSFLHKGSKTDRRSRLVSA